MRHRAGSSAAAARGSAAQRAAYSGAPLKRERRSSASSGTISCWTPNAAATASRVMSSGVPPRPPVTIRKSTRGPSRCSTSTMRSSSSGTVVIRTTRTPSDSSRLASLDAFVFGVSPDTSSLPMVRIAAVTFPSMQIRARISGGTFSTWCRPATRPNALLDTPTGGNNRHVHQDPWVGCARLRACLAVAMVVTGIVVEIVDPARAREEHLRDTTTELR